VAPEGDKVVPDIGTIEWPLRLGEWPLRKICREAPEAGKVACEVGILVPEMGRTVQEVDYRWPLRWTQRALR
jgi:hypothetical protein